MREKRELDCAVALSRPSPRRPSTLPHTAHATTTNLLLCPLETSRRGADGDVPPPPAETRAAHQDARLESSSSSSSTVGVEGGHLGDDRVHVALGRQEGRAEVPRVLLLPEARARHDDDACRLEEREGVEGVGRLARLGRGRLRLCGQRHLGEGVHAPLRRIAADALERVESGHELRGAPG
eukprot:scaffold37455_cov60-Phaeocystis_antarctica.AAC.1